MCPQEIKITGATIFTNPFQEMEQEQQQKQQEEQKQVWGVYNRHKCPASTAKSLGQHIPCPIKLFGLFMLN
jgi:hypothetical protein